MYKHVIDKRRIIFILIIYVSVLMLLSVRLYYLQVQPSTQVQGELQNHQIETLSELNYRILDTNGKDLLNYKKKYVLVIDSRPFKLNNYEETLEDLLALNFIMKSEDTNFNYSDIIALNGKTYYDEITEETYNKIKKLNNIKGIYLYVYDMVDSSEGWRIENFIANIREDNIVEGSFQHQILDIVGENEYPSISFYDMVDSSEGWRIENFIANIREDNIVEGSFQHQILDIVGENEYPSISFNLDQKANYTESILNYGENNKNLKLTINKEWEEKIRDILLDDSYSFLENIGVVLLESETGKIRAMVQKDESKANVNLGIGTIGYEPGSIFKVLTEAIGLDLGKISSSSVFTCEGKICTKLGEQYAHGDLTVDEALQVSCNDIFAKVGELSGYENMIEYTEKLGLYQKILGLSGENLTVDEALQVSCNDIFAKVGELSGYENMIEYTEKLGLYQKILGLSGENKEEAAGVKATYEDGVSNFSIGQCVTVTPLQIAGAINAVVNDGVYIKPTIIDSIIDNDDNEVEHIEVEGKSVTVTPLQIAGAINAVVNDGVYIKPTIIDSIIDNDDNEVEHIEVEGKRVFSETTAKIVQDSMTNVIWKGTGYEAKVEGITQGGKTGTSTGEGGKTNHGWFTAKIVQDSMTNVIWKGTGYEAKVEGITQGGKTGTSTGEGGKTNHGWFAGYFEMDGKKYTLLVVAPNIGDNHPDGRELGGGNTGAPIFRQIINSLIGYFEMDGKKYTLLVVAPNIGDNHPDGRELGGGNTGAPIFRQIINSLISNN